MFCVSTVLCIVQIDHGEPFGGKIWIISISFKQKAIISHVSPDILYLFRVQAVCRNDMRSDFSQTMLFQGKKNICLKLWFFFRLLNILLLTKMRTWNNITRGLGVINSANFQLWSAEVSRTFIQKRRAHWQTLLSDRLSAPIITFHLPLSDPLEPGFDDLRSV